MHKLLSVSEWTTNVLSFGCWMLAHCCVVLLCGLPAVGKSTFARLLKRVLPEKLPQLCSFFASPATLEVVHVECDEIFARVFQDDTSNKSKVDAERTHESSGAWKAVRNVAYQQVEELLQRTAAETSSQCYTLIIVDDNMYYQSMRAPFRNLARSCMHILSTARFHRARRTAQHSHDTHA